MVQLWANTIYDHNYVIAQHSEIFRIVGPRYFFQFYIGQLYEYYGRPIQSGNPHGI